MKIIVEGLPLKILKIKILNASSVSNFINLLKGYKRKEKKLIILKFINREVITKKVKREGKTFISQISKVSINEAKKVLESINTK